MPSRTVSLPQARVGRFIHDLLARGVQPHSFANEPSHYVSLSFDFELQDESYIDDAISRLIHGQPSSSAAFVESVMTSVRWLAVPTHRSASAVLSSVVKCFARARHDGRTVA